MKNKNKVKTPDIKLLYDRVLLQVIPEESFTKAGLLIPDSAKEKPQAGIVVMTGPGRANKKGEIMKMDVKVGDKITFNSHNGLPLKLDGEDYLIMNEEDVLGVFI